MGRHRPIQRTKRIKAAAIPKGTSREYEGDRDGSTRSPRAGSPPAPGWNTATNLIIRDGQRKAFQNGLAEQIKRQIAKLYQCVMWLGAGALGREDSNLRMAESKSDRFRCKINVHSEKLREFAPKCVNSLAPISEWSAFPASHRMGRRACIAGANSHRRDRNDGSERLVSVALL
jgi:hypothetical protein